MLLSPLFVGYIDKCKCWLFLEIIVFLEVIETLDKQIGIRFDFVNIILKENDNFDLTLRKRLFCDAKPTLLPCKTATFGTQNNRFCNALITKQLHNSYTCEKYLHASCRFLALIIRFTMGLYRVLHRTPCWCV